MPVNLLHLLQLGTQPIVTATVWLMVMRLLTVQTQPILVGFCKPQVKTVAPSAAWNAADCDGDGVTNGDEAASGTDPQDFVIITIF